MKVKKSDASKKGNTPTDTIDEWPKDFPYSEVVKAPLTTMITNAGFEINRSPITLEFGG